MGCWLKKNIIWPQHYDNMKAGTTLIKEACFFYFVNDFNQ